MAPRESIDNELGPVDVELPIDGLIVPAEVPVPVNVVGVDIVADIGVAGTVRVPSVVVEESQEITLISNCGP